MRTRRLLPPVMVGVWLCVVAMPTARIEDATATRVSFHNRLLLNRVVLNQLPTIEVMLAVRGNAFRTIASHVARLTGRVLRADVAVGYLRAEVPTRRFLDLVAHQDVQAYQISSLSQGAWYRDGPPQRNAEMFRGFENLPVVTLNVPPTSSLPLLSATHARSPGYTAGEDAGVAAWLDTHPKADGRGVTIALLESGLADFAHPTTRSAMTLDGREVKKIAGIVNTIDRRSPDATRVELSIAVHATSLWARVGTRTYILPRPGVYRFGLFVLPSGGNLTHHFGVLEDERSREIWIDANGNADFRDEPPVKDVNEGADVRRLTLLHPSPGEIGFVTARGRRPRTVHLYLATGGHQAMTLSVAAGSRTEDSPAAGVAPGAQVLLVRKSNAGSRLDEYIESYLDIVKRPDVDVLCDSTAIQVVPDTAADFIALIFDRLLSAYGKPIFHGAGNSSLRLGSASADGDVFSVGGTLSPRTFDVFYAGATLRDLIVHPLSAAGPSLDGAIKPDFLAPMHLVSADVQGGSRNTAIPVAAPAAQLPPGHQISCCTSASSPYAAGVAALLISRAKQEGVRYTVRSLARALRLGARFLSGTPAHEQGNGVLDVAAAWHELTNATDDPRITSSAHIVSPLAMYAARGEIGSALFERDGWFIGSRGTRSLTLYRASGARNAVVYKVSWTGNDGTFSAPTTVTLPLDEPVVMPVTITTTTAGAHSALLNLHDATTGAIRFRTQATIVAAERFAAVDRPLVIAGTVPFLGYRAHYVAIPDGIGALAVDLTVTRGILKTTILRSHGLSSAYYDNVNPVTPRAFGTGKYSVTIARPEQGTWTFGFGNDTGRRDSPDAPASTSDAEYTVTLRLLGATLAARVVGSDRLAVDVVNAASRLEIPALDVSDGFLTSHRASFLSTGFPNQYAIDVPANATALTLSLAGEQVDTRLELFVYDCTTGQCFSHSLAIPAARYQSLVIRQPRPGRWIAAVNAAPFVSGSGSFVLDEIVTTGEPRRVALPSLPRGAGDEWSYDVPLATTGALSAGRVRILRLELVDLASARNARTYPWTTAPNSARDDTVAAATYVRK